MPLGDGSGPRGAGPRTGRGLGGCNWRGLQQGIRSKKPLSNPTFWTGLLISLGIAVVDDLTQPDSRIRSIAGRLFRLLSPPPQRKAIATKSAGKFTVEVQKPDHSEKR